MKRLLLPLLALAALALPAKAAILDTTPFAKRIQFTARGYAGASTLENFPVLVRLSDVTGFDFADFTTPADELRFTDAFGNNLDYEIDTWDSTTGTALVWVSVPSLSGTTTKINAYYAPSSTSGLPTVSSTAVWTSAGYIGVWHMNAVSPADASDSGNDGTAFGSISVTSGVVGSSLSYPNTSSYVSCGSNASLVDAELAKGYTIEGWVNLASTSGKKALFGKSGFISYRMEGTAVKITTPKVLDYANVSSFITAANEWHYFSLSFATNTVNGAKHYMDGAFKTAQTTTGIDNQTGSNEMWLAHNQFGSEEGFTGLIDEYRLSASVRSADWIAADYATQNNPAFLSNSGVLTILTIPDLPANVNVDSVATNGIAVVAVNDTYTILGGTSVTIAFAPDSGYELVGSATTNFVMNADVAIPLASIPTARAIASPKTLTIAALPEHVTLVSVTVGGVTVAPASANTDLVAEGATVDVTFAPAEGYLLGGDATVPVEMDGDRTLLTDDIPTANPIRPPEVSQSATKVYARQTVEFTASAPGATSYRWLKNGVPIEGATGGTLTVDWRNPKNASTDTYRAVAVYAYGSSTVESGDSAEMTVTNVPMGVVISVLAGPPTPPPARDYLAFRIHSSGTICWKAFGNLTKTIEYRINNGAWTSITSTSGGATISVEKGDLVRFRGSNTAYATSNSAYSGFEGGSATYDIEGNIMSLLYGDDFAGNTTLPDNNYIFCSLFKKAPVISAENLILPATELKTYCYRSLFSYCESLTKAPELPATTLAKGCYWYMFEHCAIKDAPVLNAPTLVQECYGHMFTDCARLNQITCLATSGFNTSKCLEGWVANVAAVGAFRKAANVSWSTGDSGIPTGWIPSEDVLLLSPEIWFGGETIELVCDTEGAEIYYRLGQTGDFALYTAPISITGDTDIEAYSVYQGHTNQTVTQTCAYEHETPFEQSNKSLPTWIYGGNTITTPYSVNAIDGHSDKYTTGTFVFETNVTLQTAQPTYLWFQHADQSADIYVNNVKVGTHWGGYNAFFVDIGEYVHRGENNIRVALCNTTRTTLAPCDGDFNFNATLGNVKLFTSPVLPAMEYGYDGFHITSTVSASDATTNATINVETKVPAGASLVFTISDVNSDDSHTWTNTWTETQASTGRKQTFTTTIAGDDLHLWNGKIDPHLYTVTLEIYKDGDLYHRYERPYGFRYYEYVINQSGIVEGGNYTGFLLNGRPYLLRGVCMHDDVAEKANALDDSDYDQEFAIIEELGCNFIRLAHYPHPKEVYDRCDRLGIIVQTEVPCVNNLKSTQPADYYTHLATQYRDMVEQHFNHPCIVFWGLSNESTTDNAVFGKEKIDGYYDLIKGLDSERLVGYVMAMATDNPSGYYNNPKADWFGCNIYVGWYADPNSNNPSSKLNARLNKTLTIGKPLAYSEYGCGGTPHCHSEDFMTTTTRGNKPRHDIEYQMWLHEGHIAAIRNYPQLLFTSQWQLFDIAVAKRNEGFTECIDGTTVTTNDVLRHLNNKGLVERDHTTKKDTFYLYKAEWNPDPFVHICGKDYTKTTDRVIKCYTNDGDALSLYVGDIYIETKAVVDHIVTFTARDFNLGDAIRVVGATSSDTMVLGQWGQ